MTKNKASKTSNDQKYDIVFKLIDLNNDEKVCFEEYLLAISFFSDYAREKIITQETFIDYYERLFKILDAKKQNYLDKNDLIKFYGIFLHIDVDSIQEKDKQEINLENLNKQVEKLVDESIEKYDQSKTGHLTAKDFVSLCLNADFAF
jgi:Ca2+-binding EF-hand superfamily protein